MAGRGVPRRTAAQTAANTRLVVPISVPHHARVTCRAVAAQLRRRTDRRLGRGAWRVKGKDWAWRPQSPRLAPPPPERPPPKLEPPPDDRPPDDELCWI